MTRTLNIAGISVRYGRALRVQTEAVTLQGGQFVGLLGPNGAGKSSWIKAIIGAVRADLDRLDLDEEPLLPQSARDRAKKLAYLSQTRIGPPLSTVQDVIELGRHPHHGADPDARVEQIIERLDLSALRERRFGTLSGGEQARVLLARALAVDAPVLLADEPIAALDPYFAHLILRVLKDEAARGTLIIASLHDLALTQQYCDHVLVMDQGRFHTQGSVESALNPSVLAEVFKIKTTATGFAPILKREGFRTT